ncbi:MAG: hypothetical protein B7Y45_12445 [Sphingomonas sp. 28-66-16]|nr:MAG: hypothetical protein B7Y45_12445 [Sphingomonas sp. 28-66-16]
MMRATTILFAAAALAATGSIALTAPRAAAQDSMKGMSPDQMKAMHAEHEKMMHAGIVQARQAGFHLAVASFLGIKAGIARGDDVKTLALPAAALAGWGKAIPTMFPPGTDTPESDALPTVWSDRAGFETAAANMSAAARTLADLGKAGDTAGFATQFGALGKTCGACHKDYRKPEEKK